VASHYLSVLSLRLLGALTCRRKAQG
jgi:hypothetical protein